MEGGDLRERLARLEQRADTSEKHVGVLFDNMKELHREIHDGHAKINEKLDALVEVRSRAQGAFAASLKWVAGIVAVLTLAIGFVTLLGV